MFLFKFQAKWGNHIMKWNKEIVAKEGKRTHLRSASTGRVITEFTELTLHLQHEVLAEGVPGRVQPKTFMSPLSGGDRLVPPHLWNMPMGQRSLTPKETVDQAGRQTHKVVLHSTAGSTRGNSRRQTELLQKPGPATRSHGTLLPRWLFKLWIVFTCEFILFLVCMRQHYVIEARI